MSGAEVREGARAELAGYWSRAMRRIWNQDVYVDMGPTVVEAGPLPDVDSALPRDWCAHSLVTGS